MPNPPLEQRRLSGPELLEIWERGSNLPLLQKKILLANLAVEESGTKPVSELSVGEAEVSMAKLHQLLFGRQIEATASCPACGQRIELQFDLNEIALNTTREPSSPLTRIIGSLRVDFRLPTLVDLTLLGEREDTATRKLFLLKHCLLHTSENGEERSFEELPAAVLETIEQTMEEVDSAADIRLSLSCPACVHKWNAVFDITMFLWNKLDVWARRTLRDVHQLASAYGWGESEILSLTPSRRSYYLGLINA